MTKRYILLLAALVTLALLFLLDDGYDDQQAAHERYCDMVQIWHETSGEYGWPPYKGECK